MVSDYRFLDKSFARRVGEIVMDAERRPTNPSAHTQYISPAYLEILSVITPCLSLRSTEQHIDFSTVLQPFAMDASTNRKQKRKRSPPPNGRNRTMLLKSTLNVTKKTRAMPRNFAEPQSSPDLPLFRQLQSTQPSTHPEATPTIPPIHAPLEDLTSYRYPNIGDEILSFLPDRDIINFSKTSKALKEILDDSSRWDKTLRYFFKYPKVFRSLQAKTAALVTGDVLIDFFERGQYFLETEPLLVILVSCKNEEKILRFLRFPQLEG
ncbi:hypothetical protein N0V90_005240 [Kalmusia sp. IMI 367209]|nr:hypothetical protein N0V90_005240 [Kalmusia sp. IMI 367209]